MQPYGQSSWLKDSKPIKELKAVDSTIKTLLSWRVAIDNESYTILVKALWYHKSYLAQNIIGASDHRKWSSLDQEKNSVASTLYVVRVSESWVLKLKYELRKA